MLSDSDPAQRCNRGIDGPVDQALVNNRSLQVDVDPFRIMKRDGLEGDFSINPQLNPGRSLQSFRDYPRENGGSQLSPDWLEGETECYQEADRIPEDSELSQ